MVYKKVRQTFSIAHYQYIDWLLNGKQVIVFLVLFFLVQYVADPLVKLSEEVGIPFHWAETFIAASNSTYTIPLILFCFMTLMSEFPKRNYEDINFIFRSGRINWYYGQLIFALYAVITFLTEAAGLFLIRVIRISYPDNGWSPVTKQYIEKYLELGRGYGVIAVVPSEVYHHFSPSAAFFYTLLLFGGMLFCMNLIMLLFNLLNKKTTGIVINAVLIVTGLGLLYLKSDYLKLLPIGNAVLKCQNLPVTKITEGYIPVLYFIICNLLLILAGRMLIKKVQL